MVSVYKITSTDFIKGGYVMVESIYISGAGALRRPTESMSLIPTKRGFEYIPDEEAIAEKEAIKQQGEQKIEIEKLSLSPKRYRNLLATMKACRVAQERCEDLADKFF